MKFRKTNLVIILAVTFLVFSCAKKDGEGQSYISIDGNVENGSIEGAGNNLKVNFVLTDYVENVEIDIVNLENKESAGEISIYRYLIDGKIWSVPIHVKCDANFGDYYPKISYTTSNGSSVIYYYDAALSDNKYVVQITNNDDEVFTEITGVDINKIRIDQTASPESLPDLISEISDIRVVQDEVEVTYKITNIGDRAAENNYSVGYYFDTNEEIFSDNSSADTERLYSSESCLKAGESIEDTRTFKIDKTSGRAIIFVDYKHWNAEANEENNVSSQFLW